MNIAVSRVSHFNCAHRIYNKNWSDQKNEEIFGKCSNLNYHGHNYKLIVSVSGPINPETGYVIDLKNLSKIIDTEIIEKFDHRNLNLDCEEFFDLIPSAENIALVIYKKLKAKISPDYTLKATLYETDKNFVEVSA